MSPRPRSTVSVLNGFGAATLAGAAASLAGSFTGIDELGRAFLLGAFFCAVMVAIVTFGFAKVIAMLESLQADVAIVKDAQAAAEASLAAASRSADRAASQRPRAGPPPSNPLSRLFRAYRK